MENKIHKKDLYDILIELIKNGIDVYGGCKEVSFAGLYDDIYECQFYRKVDPNPIGEQGDSFAREALTEKK